MVCGRVRPWTFAPCFVVCSGFGPIMESMSDQHPGSRNRDGYSEYEHPGSARPGPQDQRWDQQWQPSGRPDGQQWAQENSGSVGGWSAEQPPRPSGGRRTGGGEYSGQGEGYDAPSAPIPPPAPRQPMFRDEQPAAPRQSAPQPRWDDEPSAPQTGGYYDGETQAAETQQYTEPGATQQYPPSGPTQQYPPGYGTTDASGGYAPSQAAPYDDYSYQSQPEERSGMAALGSRRGAGRGKPARDSLLAAVLRPDVNTELTERLARPLMIGAIALAGTSWLIVVLAAFTSDWANGGLVGGLALITGWVFALFFVASFRVWLEHVLRGKRAADKAAASAEVGNDSENGEDEDSTDD